MTLSGIATGDCKSFAGDVVRVLHICSYYASPLYRLLINELKSLGVEQEVFYFASRSTAYEANESDVFFSRCYSDIDRLFFMHRERKVLRSLYASIDVTSYEILHAHSLFTNGFVALDVKRKTGTPYVVAVRNTDINSFFKVRPWLRSLGVEIMREAEAVIFLSPAYKRKVLEHFIPRAMRKEMDCKCLVIPNGINELFFNDTPCAPRRSDGVIRVLQVGDINRNKNQLTVAKACEQIEKMGERVSYTVVGGVRDTKVASRLQKYDFIVLMPPMSQPALIDVYRNSDVFVMPSHHETFGLVYVEAMSQGLPVVYSKGQGFDGWLDNDQLGEAVDAHDVHGIAESIIRLYSTGAAGFDDCVNQSRSFGWHEIALSYYFKYGEIIDRQCSREQSTVQRVDENA